MEYIVFFCCIFIGVIFIFIKGTLNERKMRKKFIDNLKNDYGKESTRVYRDGEYEHISHFSRKYKSEFYIDDITWNDLNMDAVFMQMNHTYSSAGEECLYSMLRNPKQKDDFIRMEELISYFQNNEKNRIAMQVIFHDIGRTGKLSVCDYLDYLDDLDEVDNRKHYLLNLMYVPACLFLFVDIPLGLLALVGILIYQIMTYFKHKEVMVPYLVSFAYIFHMLQGVSELEKLKISFIEQEQKIILKHRKQFKKFSRFSFIVMSINHTGGNPLDGLFDYLRMCFHLDIIQFNKMLKEVRKHTEDIYEILQTMGMLDAIVAIGAYRKQIGKYCIPEFGEELVLEDVVHPLIEGAIKNTILVKNNVLLTGSNASGKSTFLKTVAINSLLAQSIHTCAAKVYKGQLYRLYTSMSLRDDIFSGESYYIVEIRALKRILDGMIAGDNPVLCFVDEVLRGTNTVERIAASTQILKSLGSNHVVCFAATHDIELTHLLEDQYENYHFEEEIVGTDIVFHYQLLKGRATTRNAIQLLKIMGYEENIIEKANKMAGKFMESGNWHV